MRKLIFSFIVGLTLFVSAFAATSVTTKFFLVVDDCDFCPASVTDTDGKRCILNGCSPDNGGGVSICSYNCGSMSVPASTPRPTAP